ncbi:MAG TPA: hypothetical protein VG244_12940 [Acidimicrobiales bacterium]|nr:hypothetical protein [Acidimicrobiales bacterium]
MSTLPPMVLVAPRPLRRPSSLAAAVPAGGEVLALLRGDATERPSFDPGLAGGLRAWLEDAAYGVVAHRGDLAPPLVLGPREVLGTAPGGLGGMTVDGRAADGWAADGLAPVAGGGVGVPDEVVVARLVHALFRRLVTDGDIDDPLRDALDALRAEGSSGTRTSAHVESMSEPARSVLGAVVARHVAHLVDLVPRFAPGWMPRTDDRVAIPLAGGRVVLHGVFDLLVGLPQAGTASLCALGLSTGGSWARERRSLHYLALLETLRSGTPPFRLALLETASGRYGIEDVRADHLRALASHLAAWLAGVARDRPDGGEAKVPCG